MNGRFDIDYEWLLALHQATRYVLQTRDLEEANKRVTAETQRLFSTAEVTLIRHEHDTPPKPAAGQSQMVIPLITENETFGTLYIFRDQPFTEEDMDLGDEWGQSTAWALLHIQANSQRIQYLSMLNHELKSPLTSIKGYAELYKRSDISPENKDKFVDIIHKSATWIMNLLTDLVDSERLASDAIQFFPEDIELDTFLHGQKSLQRRLSKEGQTLVIQSQTNEIITADDSRISQVLDILLDNASKYSPPQSTMTLSSQTNASQATIQVVDHGIGIDPSEHELIFQQFYRSTDPAVRQERGNGLGLFIAQRLVQKMGGEIGVKSQRGQGSTFWFTLPLAKQ